jgi:hypothetical protein
MTTEQLKQLKTTYVYVVFHDLNSRRGKNFFVEVPFCYKDFSELNDYQQKAVCQVELSKLGYDSDIRSIDADKFYNSEAIEEKK